MINYLFALLLFLGLVSSVGLTYYQTVVRQDFIAVNSDVEEEEEEEEEDVTSPDDILPREELNPL